MRTPAFWHRMNAASVLMLPLSLLYVIGANIHRALATPHRLSVPVISVGNVTAGGAGKTPTTVALAALLTSAGETPHILARGYGGNVSAPHRVVAADDWQRVGDEALLLARAAPCWVGRDRALSGTRAAEAGASLVVMDDGLQHYRVHKDISFLVLDGAYGLGNGMPLPAGPLREPMKDALSRCDAVILIGNDAHGLRARTTLPVFTAQLQPVGDTAFLREGTWFAFAGLARPEKFFDGLEQLGATLAGTQSFPDHHPYSVEEIEQLAAHARTLGTRLITTAKDAVKLPPAAREQVSVLEVALQFDDAAVLSTWLKERLAAIRT